MDNLVSLWEDAARQYADNTYYRYEKSIRYLSVGDVSGCERTYQQPPGRSVPNSESAVAMPWESLPTTAWNGSLWL